MIKTACASDFNKKNPRPPDSGTVILITVGRPFPWLDYDRWMSILGPRYDAMKRWKNSNKTEADWKIYLDEFVPKMKQIEELKAIEVLRQKVKKEGKTITLLCYCKPNEHCDRDIIKSLIDRNE